MITIQQRVNNGITLLEKHDKQWYNKIDINQLDFYDPSKCIIGQVFKDFSLGTSVLFNRTEGYDNVIPERFLGKYGFSVYFDLEDNNITRDVQLKKAWVEQINKRK